MILTVIPISQMPHFGQKFAIESRKADQPQQLRVLNFENSAPSPETTPTAASTYSLANLPLCLPCGHLHRESSLLWGNQNYPSVPGGDAVPSSAAVLVPPQHRISVAANSQKAQGGATVIPGQGRQETGVPVPAWHLLGHVA